MITSILIPFITHISSGLTYPTVVILPHCKLSLHQPYIFLYTFQSTYRPSEHILLVMITITDKPYITTDITLSRK